MFRFCLCVQSIFSAGPSARYWNADCYCEADAKNAGGKCSQHSWRAPLPQNSALLQLLEQAGVQVGLQLPGKCSLQDLALAGRAKLNIVVDELGLELAADAGKAGCTLRLFSADVQSA